MWLLWSPGGDLTGDLRCTCVLSVFHHGSGVEFLTGGIMSKVSEGISEPGFLARGKDKAVVCAERGKHVGAPARGGARRTETGARDGERMYLKEILLFLFPTGDGLLDGFGFSQDSLSFIQFVAALGIRHFLIDSRRDR